GCADCRILAGGERESTAAEAEVEQHVQRAVGLLDQVAARDADVGRAVRDELRDVLRADEQREELAPQRREQRALTARLELEARALEQVARAVGQPPLVGQRDADHGSALLPADEKTAARQWTGRGGVPDRVWLDLRSNAMHTPPPRPVGAVVMGVVPIDRKSTRLNSSHVKSTYAGVSLTKKTSGY